MYVSGKKATVYGNKAILGHLPHFCQWNELPTVALMYKEESVRQFDIVLFIFN